jgi:acylphosphatase
MYAREEAERLGVCGYARNLPDGRVEVVAEGSDALLQAFLEWCRHGPSYARVTGVEEGYSAATGEFRDFRIRSEGRA